MNIKHPIAIIAIKGNHLEKINDIFEVLRYIDTNQNKEFDDWNQFNDYLINNYYDYANKEIALRGLWTNDYWTFIFDPETVDTLDDNIINTLSNKLNSEIITFVIQSNSNTYWFSKYYLSKKRQFFTSDGKIIGNYGNPLPEELDINPSKKIILSDIINLANKFNIDLDGKNKKQVYLTKELSFNDELKKELSDFKPQKKPWWKF